MNKIIVIPIIINLMLNPQDKNQSKEEIIPISKTNLEKTIELKSYKNNEINIPITKKVKNPKKFKSGYVVKVYESKDFINIRVSISKSLLKDKKVIKLPPKKVDISIEE